MQQKLTSKSKWLQSKKYHQTLNTNTPFVKEARLSQKHHISISYFSSGTHSHFRKIKTKNNNNNKTSQELSGPCITIQHCSLLKALLYWPQTSSHSLSSYNDYLGSLCVTAQLTGLHSYIWIVISAYSVFSASLDEKLHETSARMLPGSCW